MPACELGSSFDTPNGAHSMGTTLLKRHKILPHPREERFTDLYLSTPANKPRDLVIDTGVSSISSSDASSPRILKHSKQRLGALPPTPPTGHSRQSSGSSLPIVSAPVLDNRSISNSTEARSIASPSTPPNARSPPTPDVTPPRQPPLAFRPLARIPSSRNDSFKTAREDPFSSDEEEGASTVRPVLPSTRTSSVEVPKVSQVGPKRKEVGLGLGGLGLESTAPSDNEGTTTPKQKQVDRSQEEFVVFDGEWGAGKEDVNEVTKEWDSNLMRNVTVRKRPNRHRFSLSLDGPADTVLEDDIVSPTVATKVVRSLPLQERIAKHRLARDMSERTPAADRYSWTPAMAPDSPITSDVRRLSTMSGRSTASTVVEAVVVDTAPVRRKTLRHSKKQIGLRDFSSDQSTMTSAQTSVVSIEPQHRLHHPVARIPDNKHRSAVSNATISTTSSSGKSRKEIVKGGGIPVVVIPDRKSSTKSSKPPSLRSTSSRKTKRSLSLSSAPLSNPSKFNEPGYLNTQQAPTRGRTMSESAGSGSVHTIDFPPKIPTRSSSLSAPTSRNTSRAGSRTVSLTAESLKAHNQLQATRQKATEPELRVTPTAEPVPGETVEQVDPIEPDTPGRHSRLNVDHNGDPFFGKRLSTQVTPFSQISYETAGTAAEVSEALAVSIYPHQNKSVLVVQHEPLPPNIKTVDMATNTEPAGRPNPKIIMGPVTPPQPTHPMDAIDSPLRNPRAPPEPPAIKFIPPTPAGTEEDRELGGRPSTSDNTPPKRSMSLMRRFSSRRSSEPAAGPGFIRRALSLSKNTRQLADGSTQTSKGEANPSSIYPSVVDRPADGTKLHPFWRPANFWDDLEDDGFVDGWPEIDNRPGPPKRSLSDKFKRSIGIEDSNDIDDRGYRPVDRRTMVKTPGGNLRVVKQRSTSSLRRERLRPRDGSRQRPHTEGGEKEWGANFREGNGGSRVHVIPGLGLRVQYVGWSGIKRRMSERRREKLRGRISGPKALRGGVDDVLRLSQPQ